MPVKQTKAQLEADLTAAREKIHELEARLATRTKRAEVSWGQALQNHQNAALVVSSKKVIGINRSAESLFGYAASEVSGQSLDVLLPGFGETQRGRPSAKTSKRASNPTGSTPSLVSGMRKDGSCFAVQVDMIQPPPGAGDVEIIILTNIQDETKRHSWLANEQIFSEVMESIHEVLYLTDIRNRKILYISPAYEAIWGRTVESVYQDMHTFVDAIDDAYKPEVFGSLDRQARGEVTMLEYRITRPDGSMRWIRDRGFPVFDEHGNFVRVTGIAEDITEYKKAHLALQASELNYRTLVEHTDNAIAILDKQGTILFANAKGTQIWNDPQIVGKTIFEIFPEQYAQRYYKVINTVIEQKQGVIDEIESSIHNTPKWFRLSMQPMQNEEGVIDRLLLSAWETTNQRLEHEKLAQSEMRFRGYFEQPNIGIAMISHDMKWLEVNNAMAAMLGYSREEFLQLEWHILTHPDEREETLRSFMQVVQGQTDKFSLEKRCVTKGKDVIFINLDVQAVRKSNGELDFLLTTIQNITERIKASEQVKFQAYILDKVEQAVIVTNRKGIITFWNSFAERLYGYTAREVIGRPITEVTVAEQSLEEALQIMEHLKRGQSWNGDFLVQTKSGKAFHAAVTNTPMFDANGRLTGIIGVSSDVTQRKEFEKQTIYQASLLRDISDAIIATDEHFRITEWNKAAERLYGWTSDEVKGTLIMDVVKTEYPDEKRDTTYKGVDEGGLLTSKVIHRRKDGSPLYINSSVTALLDDKGIQHGIIAVNRDESERLKAEEALRQSEAKFHRLFDTMAQGVLYFNTDGEITSANPAAEDILGVPLQQMQGRSSLTSLWKVVHENGSEFSGQEHPVVQVLKTGKPVYDVVMGMYRPNQQRYRWLIVNVIPEFRSGEERPYQVHATLTDITWRKETEQTLYEANARMRATLDALPDHLFELDENYLIIDYHAPAMQEASLTSTQHLIGESFYTLAPADKLEYLQRVFRQTKETGKSQGTLYSLPDSKGVLKWFEFSASTKKVLGKTEVHYIVLVRDVTDRINLEKALIESQELYKSLVESQDSLLALLDESGSILFLNNNAATLLGGDPVSLVGSSILEFLPSMQRKEQVDGFRQVTATGQNAIFDTAIPLGGQQHWYRVSIQPVRNATGSITRVLVNATDITDRKESERLLEEKVRLRTAEIETVQKRLQLATRAVGLGIWELTPNNGNLVWDERMYEIYGYKPGEIQEDLPTFMRLVHPDDVVSLIGNMQMLLEGQVLEQTTYRIIRPNNEVRHVKAHGMVIYDEHKAVDYIVGTVLDITNDTIAEQNLRESESQNRLLFEESPDPAILLDGHGHYVRVNHAYEVLSGYSQELLIGKHPYELGIINEEITKAWEGKWQELLGKKGTNTSFEFKHTGRNNIVQIVEARLYPVTISGVTHILCNMRDVTERNQVQEKLQSLAQRLELATQSAGTGIWDCDLKAGITDWDDQSLRLFGVTREQYESGQHTWQSLIHPDDYEEVMQSYWAAIRLEAKFNQEYRIICPDKSIRYIQDNAIITLDADGKPDHAIGTFNDITSRKLSEIKLASLAQRLELATKSAKIGIWEWNIKENTLLWDEQSYKLFGLEPRSETNPFNMWATCVHPDDLSIQMELLNQTNQHGMEYASEYRIIWPDQTIHYINSNAITLYDKDGTPMRMIGTNLDVTLRRQAEMLLKRREETLSKANRELERAIRMKDEFLASMSHELRTPLTGILGLSEAMQYMVYGELNEKQLNALANIRNSGQHLLELINDILDVSKIEAGKLELVTQITSLNEICQASVRLVKVMAQKKQQAMEIEIDTQPVYINIDARRIKQVLVNLLNNAVKFTPEGGTLGLKAHADEEKRVVTIQIWDRGVGIGEEDQEKLFKPFVQLDSSLSRQNNGTGLGLVLVKRLTELHGGTLDLRSEVGRGSTFTITLPWDSNPLAPSSEAQLPDLHNEPMPIPAKLPSIQEAEAKDLSHMPLVLIVDDNPTNIETIADFLTANQYRIRIASSGMECLQYLPQIRPNLILMDIQMPTLDGLETTRQIRANPNPQLSAIPVIALTALAMPGDREQCMAAGANDYMSKPFRLLELLEMVKTHIKPMQGQP